MAEEYVYERERELLDYYRNNLTDPETRRSISTTDTFIASDGQTKFELKNTLVKNVADTIKVASITLRKGHNYTIVYGEGKNPTILLLNSGATLNDEVKITYCYGKAMIEREYSRTDVTLPRVVMMFLTGSEDPAGLGDCMNTGKGTYFNASYRFEIRDKYASRARELASKAFNLGMKIRHANLFRVIITNSSDMANFDYDIEKNAYIIQFTLDITWDLMFE